MVVLRSLKITLYVHRLSHFDNRGAEYLLLGTHCCPHIKQITFCLQRAEVTRLCYWILIVRGSNPERNNWHVIFIQAFPTSAIVTSKLHDVLTYTLFKSLQRIAQVHASEADTIFYKELTHEITPWITRVTGLSRLHFAEVIEVCGCPLEWAVLKRT